MLEGFRDAARLVVLFAAVGAGSAQAVGQQPANDDAPASPTCTTCADPAPATINPDLLVVLQDLNAVSLKFQFEAYGVQEAPHEQRVKESAALIHALHANDVALKHFRKSIAHTEIAKIIEHPPQTFQLGTFSENSDAVTAKADNQVRFLMTVMLAAGDGSPEGQKRSADPVFVEALGALRVTLKQNSSTLEKALETVVPPAPPLQETLPTPAPVVVPPGMSIA